MGTKQHAYRRSCALTVLVGMAANGLTACGGSKTPSVANIASTSTPTKATGTDSGGNSTSTVSTGNAAALLVE